MKFSIITPTYNSEDLLTETINSIQNQTILSKNDHEIEHIIVDGASKDRTLKIVREYAEGNSRHNLHINVISEEDSGMYNALVKGLKCISGEVVSYLNAGDLYFPNALEVVEAVFHENEEIYWLTGLKSEINAESQVTKVRLPFRYKQKMIRKGIYGRYLPYIEQESTFWKKELLSLVDFKMLNGMNYAGDYYLWYRFSSKHQLFIVKSLLGFFRKHTGQISENINSYNNEQISFVDKIQFYDYLKIIFEKMMWFIASDYFCLIVNKKLVIYSKEKNKWVLNENE